MSRSIVTYSEEETMSAGRKLASEVQPGTVITLSGGLGAGKTCFAKGFAWGLGLQPEQVDSPTFTLLQEYETPSGLMLYHFDFYRVESAEEAVEIGTEEYFYGDGISLVEWPERIAPLIPEDAIRISLDLTGPNRRTISIEQPTGKAVT